MEDYLTPEEAAEILKVKKTTIWTWLRTGKLKGIKTGKIWRIRKEDLFNCLEKDENTLTITESQIREYINKHIRFEDNMLIITLDVSNERFIHNLLVAIEMQKESPGRFAISNDILKKVLDQTPGKKPKLIKIMESK